MPLLVNQNHLRHLTDDPTFLPTLLDVVTEALRHARTTPQGYASFLKFPLGPGDPHTQAVQLYPFSTPDHGCFVRITPVSGQPRPPAESDFVLHLDRTTGELLALIATDDLSPLRTALPIGVACRHLAPEQPHTLALLGTGIQAHYQLRTLLAAMPSLLTVRVFSRQPENRASFVQQMQNLYDSPNPGRPQIVAVDSIQAALTDADIVCVTAGGREPVIDLAHVRPGALITSINPTAVPQRPGTRVVVAALEGPEVHPSGWEPHSGFSMPTPTTTLVDIITGQATARSHEKEQVLYMQLGAGVWDGALLHFISSWTREHGAGAEFFLTAKKIQ